MPWNPRGGTLTGLRWSKKQWKVEIEICSQNHVRSPQQRKMKIKYKFCAISTLQKNSKEKGQQRIRTNGQDFRRIQKHFQERGSSQQLHKHTKICRMRT